MRKREVWVDWAKAILIWLMIVGHAGCDGIPRDFIYAFHMPAFFIISGYLYKPHPLVKTIKSFGVPILFFSMVNLALIFGKVLLKGESVDYDFLSQITPPYWKCNWGNYITLFRGVWFIIVLFFMRILLGDIPLFSFIRKSYKIILPVLLFYMLIEPFFIHRMPQVQDYYLYKVIACMPFMMFGLLLKEYKTWMLSFGKYTFGGLLLVYIILVLYNGKNDIWAYTFTHGYFLFAVNAMLASLIFFNILKKTHQSQIIISFSKGTLLIMGMHELLINIFSRLFSKVHILIPETILSFVNGILVMVVCYFLIRLALRYCPVILGK